MVDSQESENGLSNNEEVCIIDGSSCLVVIYMYKYPVVQRNGYTCKGGRCYKVIMSSKLTQVEKKKEFAAFYEGDGYTGKETSSCENWEWGQGC